MARGVTVDRNPKQPTREAQELANSHRRLTTQVQSHPLFAKGEPREMENVDFPAGTNVVLRHGLGRICKRWIIVHVDSGTPDITFVSADSNTTTLVSSTACAVDLWVM